MSAEDNAPEQAREVEVVALLAQVLDRRTGGNLGIEGWLPAAEAILRALAPVRAAERQEAARAALLAAADDVATMQRIGETPRSATTATDRAEFHGHPLGIDLPFYGTEVRPVVTSWLRDRADGVTGRSGTS